MNTIQVVNVKCWGCAKTVIFELEELGITNIIVWFEKEDSVESRTIQFEWDSSVVKKKLRDLWYPEVWTKEAKSLLKKAKSFVSCAVGKMKK